MAGVLQFTLGLEVSEFLRKIGFTAEGILGLAGAGEAFRKVFERTFQAIEQAGGLQHLSKRTGESVANLFRLQEAFKACGGEAESVDGLIFQMQKSLGGVNEIGERTEDVFRKLGLDIGKLKDAGAADALQQIISALAGVNQESAAKSASMIFGRMGAGTAVQLSRSSQEFSQVMREAAPQAAVFERIAAASAKVEATLQAIKRQFAGLFAGIAQGALPAIQQALNLLNKVDFTSMGQKIGRFIFAVFKSFSSGQFGDLLALSIQAGLEKGLFYATNFAVTFAAAISAALGPALKAAFELAALGAETLGEQIWRKINGFASDTLQRGISDIEARAKKEGRPLTSGEQTSVQIMRQQQAETAQGENDMRAGLLENQRARRDEIINSANTAIRGAIDAVAKSVSSWGQAPDTFSKQLEEKVKALSVGFSGALSEMGGDSGAGKNLTFSGIGHVAQPSEIEKLGFVLDRGSGLGLLRPQRGIRLR